MTNITMQADFNYDCTPSFVPFAYKFTGKERDAESGLDYFPARYFASSNGRWMSPDLLGGHLEKPQSLNKYAYVLNNPLRFSDPMGLDPCQNDDGSIGDDGNNTGNLTFPNSCPVTVDNSDLSQLDSSANSPDQLSASMPASTGGGVDPIGSDSGGFDNPFGQALFHGAGAPYLIGANQVAGTFTGVGSFYGSSLVGAGAVLTAPGATAAIVARPIGWYLATAAGSSAAVLGKFPEYLDDAEELGANVFNMAPRVYNFLANYGQAWTANRAFLDRVVQQVSKSIYQPSHWAKGELINRN